VTTSETTELQTIADLVSALELSGVHYVEISARRVWDRDADTEAAFEMAVQTRVDPTTFAQRFRLAMGHLVADYIVEVETIYTATSPITFKEEAGHEFIERVAVMAAYPFIREAVATSAARLEVEVPVLGLLRAGQFKLGAVSDEQGAGSNTTEVDEESQTRNEPA
jgi:hypothetical protein